MSRFEGEIEFTDDLTQADAGFCARAEELETLFALSWRAVLAIMCEDPDEIAIKEERPVECTASEIESLLYDFLEEELFLKDAKRFLGSVQEIDIVENRTGYALTARIGGELFDPDRHRAGTDVKAVTMYGFSVRRNQDGWEATVVVDT